MFNTLRGMFYKYKDVILYLIFGVATTVVNIVSYAVLARLLGEKYLVLNNTISWILSVLFAYITNKIWVFNSVTDSFKALAIEFTSFVSCRFITFLLDTVILYLGVKVLFLNDIAVKIFSNVLVIIINYIASKLVIFRDGNKDAPKPAKE